MPSIDKREVPVHGMPANGAGAPGGVSGSRSLFDREILAHAILDALRKFRVRLSASTTPHVL